MHVLCCFCDLVLLYSTEAAWFRETQTRNPKTTRYPKPQWFRLLVCEVEYCGLGDGEVKFVGVNLRIREFFDWALEYHTLILFLGPVTEREPLWKKVYTFFSLVTSKPS